MSVYLTIAVSVERYISVVYPLLSIRLHCHYSYLYMSLPAILFSIVFTLPNYFMLETNCDEVRYSYEIFNENCSFSFLEFRNSWTAFVLSPWNLVFYSTAVLRNAPVVNIYYLSHITQMSPYNIWGPNGKNSTVSLVNWLMVKSIPTANFLITS